MLPLTFTSATTVAETALPAGTAPHRPAHRHRQRGERERAQQQEQPLLQLNAPDLAPVHFGEELERGELHLARALAGEEVNDDRDRGRRQPEQEEGVQEAQRGYSTKRWSESSHSSTRVTGWISQPVRRRLLNPGTTG